jgi:hypothetical protein
LHRALLSKGTQQRIEIATDLSQEVHGCRHQHSLFDQFSTACSTNNASLMSLCQLAGATNPLLPESVVVFLLHPLAQIADKPVQRIDLPIVRFNGLR